MTMTLAPTALSFNADPVAWLPEAAADRLRALRQHSADLNALIPKSDDRLAAANAKVEAERRLARLRAHQSAPGGGFNLKDDDPRVMAAIEQLDKLTADHARISDLYEVRGAAYVPASQTLHAVQTWLRDGRPPGTVLEDHEMPEPKLNKGESLMDAIERHRRRVRELRANLHAIRSAPMPSAHCKRRMREQIEALAARGAVNVSGLVEHDGDIEWPRAQQTVAVRGGQGASATVEQSDTPALIAYLFKDLLLKKLDAEIDNEADDGSALSVDVRQRQEAEVRADLLAVERDESSLVWMALEQNLPVFHRVDCAPEAILQCTLVAAPRETPSGTSPGMSFGFGTRR